MAKATLSVTVQPAEHQVSRHAETFAATPSENLRGWTTTNAELDALAGAAYIKPEWNPSTYAYGIADYHKTPSTPATIWTESAGALGRGDKGVGFAGSNTVPLTTPWSAFLDTTHQLQRGRGVVLSFIWYRPSDDASIGLRLLPRVDPTVFGIVNGVYYYFSPFLLAIDSQMKMRVYEYPYDNYDAFNANPTYVNTETYTHPLVVSPEALASQWHSVQIQALSDDDVLITSDILKGGGFVYRSAMDRQNIWMLPEGVAGIQTNGGGAGQVQVTPLHTADTGIIKSDVYSKSVANAEYPTVKVNGWSPALLETDRGFMDSTVIPGTVAGTGGIAFNVYSVVKNHDGSYMETVVDPSAGTEFKDFRVELTMTPTNWTSPVINDVIVNYDGATTTITDPVVDITDDVIEMKGGVSEDGRRFSFKIKNKDGKYNSIAERVMNQVTVQIDTEDVAVLYTMNPSYQWFQTPTQAALTLDWETEDEFGYLKRELCARCPAYDGQLLSDCLTEFLGRMGYDASRLDIEASTVRLPKKRGKEPYQFKPEDGTPAYDFIQKLKEWFASTHILRAGRSKKIEFKSVAAGMPTLKRTYYPASAYKPTTDDHVIYRDCQNELLMDEFYNEIWVCGEDKRNRKPLIALYRDSASQTDKNAPNYVGRRLIMIVLTKFNRQDALDATCNQLKTWYGRWRVRTKFNTRVDPTLEKDDFIGVYGGGTGAWRVECVDYDVGKNSMADSVINSETPVIKGMTVMASQWPVVI